MRHFFSLLSVGLLLTTTAYAQLGLRAGGSLAGQTTNPFAHLSGGSSLTTSSALGYQLGLTYRLPWRRHWALVPELQFSREREQASIRTYDQFYGSEANYEVNLSYLNAPVLLRLTLGPIYLEAGPQLSLLIGGHAQGTLTYTGSVAPLIYYDPRLDQDAIERYQRFDAGACVGVGVQVVGGLGVSVRAYQGLGSMDRSSTSRNESIPPSSSKAYRQTLQASLTYQLPSCH